MASLHLAQEIFKLIYPVGSIYLSTSATNPGTIFGGTWEHWGKGRVPVSIDTSQTEFNTVNKTGGFKTNEHNHITSVSFDGNAVFINISPVAPRSIVRNVDRIVPWTGSSGTGLARNDSTDNETINILQPYICCYMWRRIA